MNRWRQFRFIIRTRHCAMDSNSILNFLLLVGKLAVFSCSSELRVGQDQLHPTPFTGRSKPKPGETTITSDREQRPATATQELLRPTDSQQQTLRPAVCQPQGFLPAKDWRKIGMTVMLMISDAFYNVYNDLITSSSGCGDVFARAT